MHLDFAEKLNKDKMMKSYEYIVNICRTNKKNQVKEDIRQKEFNISKLRVMKGNKVVMLNPEVFLNSVYTETQRQKQKIDKGQHSRTGSSCEKRKCL